MKRSLDKRISKVEKEQGITDRDPCHIAFKKLDGSYIIHHREHGRFELTERDFNEFESRLQDEGLIIMAPLEDE